jgi:hypothetical protein
VSKTEPDYNLNPLLTGRFGNRSGEVLAKETKYGIAKEYGFQ